MSWIDDIPGCFGSVNLVFAGHPSDQERAKAMFEKARSEGVSFDDFCEEIEQWLRDQGCNEEFVKEQMDSVRSADSYY